MAELSRRAFLKSTGSAAVVAAGAGAVLAGCNRPAPTAAPGVTGFAEKHEWKMVTTWPPGSKVLHEGAELIAKWIGELSGGRIAIRVYGGGELVPPMGVFDAVSGGQAEIGHGASYYWSGKVPAAQFFCAVPFGMNAQQMNAWLFAGGGAQLWTEVYRERNLVPFAAGNTGVQMGGWFKREIHGLADLKGLKMRIPGLGGQVMAKAGVAVVTTPAQDIFNNLERGVIDAAEWVGPCHDYILNLHRAADNYYYPGWQEPGSVLELIVNRETFDALSPDLQAIIRAAADRSNNWVLAQFESLNNHYLSLIKQERPTVVLRPFPAEVLAQLRAYSVEAVNELIGSDPMSRKVYDSYVRFQQGVAPWSAIGEKPYYNNLSHP